MKKHLQSVIFISIIMLLFSSCSSHNNDSTEKLKRSEYIAINNLDGVTMEVDEQTISPTSLTVIFNNGSDKECIYGDPFVLEKLVDDEWYEGSIILEDGYGFNDIGYELPPNSTSEWAVDWEWLYGKLDVGDYRIIKEVLDFRKPGDYDEYYLAARFTIN